MKKLFKYYVCDSLTESVVGNFFAINDSVAKKVVIDSVNSNEKLKQIGSSLYVVKDITPYTEYETFDEVRLIEDSIGFDWSSEWMKKEE